MPTAENALIYYEAGQTFNDFEALTDDGDQINFKSTGQFWSNRSDRISETSYAADVKPNGLATGGVVTAAASGTNNLVDVAALTCYLAGTLTSVNAATDQTCTRAANADTHIINSITVTSLGAIAVVAGTDGTSFSTTRGANGGPPWIPTGSIEIAQVKFSAQGAAAVTADEIFAVPNTHTEWYNFPTWEQKNMRVSNLVLGYAGPKFASALPLIHSDDAGTSTAAKKIYASFYEASFSEVPKGVDFVPAETTHSVASTQIYGQTIGATSKSLGQGSFTFYATDGISDGLLKHKDEELWFKFKQDKLKDPYIAVQGKLGVSRSFPAGDNINVACTISAENAAEEVVS